MRKRSSNSKQGIITELKDVILRNANEKRFDADRHRNDKEMR